MDIISFINPRYSAADNSTIDIDVVFAELGPDPLPFTATADMDVYQRCVAGEAGPIAPYQAPPLTELFETARRLVNDHVDRTAQAKGYNDAVACASYASSGNAAWAAEAAAFVGWRDAVWTQVFALRDQAAAGTISNLPTGAELIAALPVMVWPA